jgi:hypothetical protein
VCVCVRVCSCVSREYPCVYMSVSVDMCMCTCVYVCVFARTHQQILSICVYECLCVRLRARARVCPVVYHYTSQSIFLK